MGHTDHSPNAVARLQQASLNLYHKMEAKNASSFAFDFVSLTSNKLSGRIEPCALQRATRKICEIKTLSRSCLVMSFFFIFAVEEVIIIKELLRSYSERPCLFTWMLYY